MIEREEERFESTIEAGIGRLEDLVSSLKSCGETQIAGEEAFRLYETYGFPRELTQDIAAEAGLSVDEEGYRLAAEQHSERSVAPGFVYESDVFGGSPTEFVGYGETQANAKIDFIGEGTLILDRTPFYAESGGQVGDQGEIVGSHGRARVLDTKKAGQTWVHSVEIEGELNEGDAVTATVDAARRRAIERAHSATHLLHAALREHLGAHVQQRGSLVEADRLRFDFVHFEPMASEEIRLVENTVNKEILRSTSVEIAEKTLAEAKAMGAMALFGEKYGERVRTVKMGDFSLELCGGTHLPTTSAAGVFRIVSETGVSANVRRIEALTGLQALDYDRAQTQTLREVADELGARPENVVPAAEKLKARVRDLERELAAAQRKLGGGASDEILANATEINGIRVVASRAPEGLNAQALRELADQLADKLDGVVVLAAENEGKVTWAVKASKGAVEAGAHAGNIVKKLAQITGGGGGGRPDFAQAGGKDASKIDEALSQAPSFVGV